MSEQAETHTDIIADMRKDAAEDESSPDYILAQKLNYYADCMEAAHKRDVEKLNSVIQAQRSAFDAEIDRLRREATELRKQGGNAAAMREALEALSAWAKTVKDNPKDKTATECAEFVETAIAAALAAPPRNCDVGTAEEQFDRMFVFCRRKGKCTSCEHHKIGTLSRQCTLRWAQMPYEKGGAK